MKPERKSSSGNATTAGNPAADQPMNAAKWMQEVRALDVETLLRLGVKLGRNKHGEETVGLPYRKAGEVRAYKVRHVGDKDAIKAEGKPPFYWSPSGAEHGLFNGDVLDELQDQPVIVTEGEFDALSVMQAGFARAVSLPDGWVGGDPGRKGQALVAAADKLRRSPCVIVAGDNDETGRSLVRFVWNVLDTHPVRFVEWPEGCKDANETLQKFGEGEVARCINAAKMIDPPGGVITGFSDSPPEPEGAIYTTGHDCVDRVLAFHVGFPTIVTGIPQSGKSTFLTWALTQAIRENKIRVGACLMETPTSILRDQLARMATGRPWSSLAKLERDALLERLDRDWRILHREEREDAPTGMAWVRDMMRTAAVRDGCKIVVFDPWNEIEHRVAPGESVTDYTNAALAKARQWSERFGCALVVVAHPTKMQGDPGAKPRAPLGYDISGSSAWANKAAIGLTVHREEDETGSHTAVINWKSKFTQLYPCRNGRVRLDFDENSMVFRRRMH